MVDSNQDTAQPKARSVRKLSGWHVIAVEVLAFVTRAWCSTLRIQPDEEARRCLADPSPTVFVLWHNRLFGIGEVHRRFRRPHVDRPIYGLISASKDGAWLAAFFEKIGIRAIRGSSSWRGMQALRESLKVLDEGDLGITPDGPRGPCYDFKSGAALIARKTDCPVVLLSLNYGRSKRLGSWDRFYLPWPFTKVELLGRRADIKTSGPLEPLAEELKCQLTAITRDR
ncbi:lysophospholipid acyltransferase family protein [Cerasicoccus frondis]|uniref:lysophospholipid acyltransferase family protein n=1 Tax=Cerasicoccus frondis TaxID=490090 RepID=UPI0028526A0C|nr:lysophospholipid acyltransferase family protein [Cerasicoccus frondis]